MKWSRVDGDLLYFRRWPSPRASPTWQGVGCREFLMASSVPSRQAQILAKSTSPRSKSLCVDGCLQVLLVPAKTAGARAAKR